MVRIQLVDPITFVDVMYSVVTFIRLVMRR
jgi:hypothetical protein